MLNYFLLKLFKKKAAISLLFFYAMIGVAAEGRNMNDSVSKKHPQKATPRKIGELLSGFYPLTEKALYSVTVCADLAVNKDPHIVYRKGEPGHVFFILNKTDLCTGELTNRSFGFYPKGMVTFITKKVRSQIRENDSREYNASLTKKLTLTEFAGLLENCKTYAEKKYDLNRFNCYDYVVMIFNAIPGIEKLRVSRVRFPFIFGKGGSPCGLFSDLKMLVDTRTSWAPAIQFGVFTSPPTYEIKK